MLKTIRGKVTLWCILIVGTLNILLSLFIYSTFNSKLETTISENMQSIKYIAKNLAMVNVNIAGSSEELSNSCKALVDDLYKYYSNYISITLKDNSEYNRGNILASEQIQPILSESENIKSILKLNKIKDSYVATYNYPIYIEDKYFGNLVAQKDYTSKYKENYSIMVTIFTGQFLLLLILVVALLIIIGKLTLPIKKLSIAMESFGKGENESDIKVSGNDEVAHLSRSFNSMRNQINSQIDAILAEQKLSREFFNNATHELKTPITAISGYAQVLLEEDIVNMDEDFRDRALIRMVKESDKLNKLAKNILDISKGNSIIQEQKETFDLGKLLQSKIDDMQVRLSKYNLVINSNIEAIEVNLLKEDISTIITNLLDNAIKYSSDSIIKVSLSKTDDNYEIKITNSIFELPQDIKDKLLEPFIKYTSDEVLQKEGITSSGLGLYLCNELAKKNDCVLNYFIVGSEITFVLKDSN